MKFSLRKEDSFIKLGQLLKACNMVSSGSEAKTVITNNMVKVNNEICNMRGKKIYKGDIVIFNDKEVNIV